MFYLIGVLLVAIAIYSGIVWSCHREADMLDAAQDDLNEALEEIFYGPEGICTKQVQQ